jgi:hypothetical protein
MSRFDQACNEIVVRAQGGIACCLIDAAEHRVLGRSVGSLGPLLAEERLHALCGLLHGGAGAQLARVVGTPAGFEEIRLICGGHGFFAKLVASGRAVLLSVTDEDANIGRAWAQLRSCVPDVEALLM